MKRITSFAAVLAVCVAPAAAAAAQPKSAPDPAAAQSLFYEARALMAHGKYAEACPKLEESNRLDHGIGTQYNLADCNEHIGKITTAWAGFLEVAAQSKVAHQVDREKVARRRAQALEPRLPKLVLDVPATIAGLEVRRDGVVVGAAQWAEPIPVDPGPHEIVATAPGKEPWKTTVTAPEGKVTKVSLPRELAPAPVAAAPPAAAQEAETATTTTTSGAAPVQTYRDFPAPSEDGHGDTQRTVGWIAAAAGVAGLATGGGFGLASLNKRNDARSHCQGDACDSAGVNLRNEAIRNGNVATVATIAGGIALVSGVLLLVTAPSEQAKRSGRVQAAPQVGANGGGFLVQGSFQ